MIMNLIRQLPKKYFSFFLFWKIKVLPAFSLTKQYLKDKFILNVQNRDLWNTINTIKFKISCHLLIYYFIWKYVVFFHENPTVFLLYTYNYNYVEKNLRLPSHFSKIINTYRMFILITYKLVFLFTFCIISLKSLIAF